MGSQARNITNYAARRAAGLAAFARYEKAVAAFEFHRSRNDKTAAQHYEAQCDAIDEELYALEAVNHHSGRPAFLLSDAEMTELQAIYPAELARLEAQQHILPLAA